MKKDNAMNDVLKAIKNWQKVCEDSGEVPSVVGMFVSVSKKELTIPTYAVQGDYKEFSFMVKNLKAIVKQMEEEECVLPILTEEQARERIIEQMLKVSKDKGGNIAHLKIGKK